MHRRFRGRGYGDRNPGRLGDDATLDLPNDFDTCHGLAFEYVKATPTGHPTNCLLGFGRFLEFTCLSKNHGLRQERSISGRVVNGLRWNGPGVLG
jgi:hypothetical protein